MANIAKIQRTVRVLGMTLKGGFTRTGTDSDSLTLNLPRGIAGTMTARASSSQATFTLTTARHGYYPGMEVDMWYGNDPTISIPFLSASVVSISGASIVLNVTNCLGTTFIPDVVGTSVVISPQIGFDLSKIEDSTQVKVMSYQTIFGKTSGVRSGGTVLQLHSNDDGSEPPHTIAAPLKCQTFDSEQRFPFSENQSFSDQWPLTNYLYGKTSNPSSTSNAIVRLAYLLEDLGS